MISALMNESEEIKTPHLRAGLAIWEYALASARYLFGDKQEVSLDRRILRILREAKCGLARTQISAALNHHASGEAITSSLGRLKRQGLVEPQIKKTRGRPMERWCAV
jgi:hypothetical protein